MKPLFWICLSGILYVYIGYPVLIYILSRFYKKPVGGKYVYPKISIVIAVYNEEKTIENKLRNFLQLDYPKERMEILIGSDGSRDRTNEILTKLENENKTHGYIIIDKEKILTLPQIKICLSEERNGKPKMLNRLVSMAKGEIIVFTDARQRLDNNSLNELVKHFSDPKVGSVSAALFYESSENGGKTREGIGLYWEYEKFIRKSESRMGSMLGATGALYAIRRELFPELPADIILDDVYIPMKIVEKGYRAIFDKKAKIFDRVALNPKDEFTRRVRMLAGNFQLVYYLGYLFTPFKGMISWQFFSHKFLRLMVPFLLAGLFISNLFLVEIYWYKVFFILQCLFYGLAGLGALYKGKNSLLDVPHMFCVMNWAAVVGLYRFLSGRQKVTWEKVS